MKMLLASSFLPSRSLLFQCNSSPTVNSSRFDPFECNLNFMALCSRYSLFKHLPTALRIQPHSSFKLRLIPLFHWKVLCKMFYYLSERGSSVFGWLIDSIYWFTCSCWSCYIMFPYHAFSMNFLTLHIIDPWELSWVICLQRALYHFSMCTNA